jgi:ligand-binding SRPBCC domain-containing protein
MSQRFEAEQWTAAPLHRLFAFFGDPHNLPRILPPRRRARLLRLSLVRPHFPAGEMTPFEARAADGREGILIRDVVEYEVGFGVIGTFLEKVLFQRVMRSTFEHRKRSLERIFPPE